MSHVSITFYPLELHLVQGEPGTLQFSLSSGDSTGYVARLHRYNDRTADYSLYVRDLAIAQDNTLTLTIDDWYLPTAGGIALTPAYVNSYLLTLGPPNYDHPTMQLSVGACSIWVTQAPPPPDDPDGDDGDGGGDDGGTDPPSPPEPKSLIAEVRTGILALNATTDLRIDLARRHAPGTPGIVLTQYAAQAHEVATYGTYRFQIAVYHDDMAQVIDLAEALHDAIIAGYGEMDGRPATWDLSSWESRYTTITPPVYVGTLDAEHSHPEFHKFTLTLTLLARRTSA